MIKKYHVSKNLLDMPDSTFTITSGTAELNCTYSKGILSLSGTVSEIGSTNQNWKDYLSFYLDAGTYSLNIPSGLGANYGRYLRKYDDNVVIMSTGATEVTLTERTRVYIGLYIANRTLNDQLVFMCNEGSSPLPYEPYDPEVWHTIGYKKYETATDTITSLPKTIIGDGQPISAYTIKGNMQQSGTPTPSTPIYPTEVGEKTANLLNVADFTATTEPVSQDKQLWSGTLSEGTYTVSINQDDSLTSNTRNTIHVKVGSTNYYENSTANYHNDSGLHSYTFSVTGTQTVTIYYWTNAISNNVSFSQAMLNTGSTALPYEPYGLYKIPILSNGVSYPIYLSEPIRKISTYVDSVPSTGTASRIIKKIVFDGSESWSDLAEVGGRVRYRIQLSDMQLYASTSKDIRCTHYNTEYSISQLNQNTVNNCLCGYDNYVYIYSSDYATLTDFKAFLTANPITVWYVLATAQTESFTAPTIPTTGTAQSFDVDTTLKPSEVSLTYHGWHEHSDTKYTSG